MDKFIGIDISKQTFDVSFSKKNQDVYENNLKGFKKFMKKVNKGIGVIMEASGPYYVELATFLYDNKIDVYVINPLKIKRFSQMNFNRAKTDRKDADVIRYYGEKMGQDMKAWAPETKPIKDLKQLKSCIELLHKQINQTGNQLGALEDTGYACKEVKKSLTSILKKLQKDKVSLEKKMAEIAKKEYYETLNLLISIPGLGIKTSIMLIAVTDNFEKFENYKQLIAFLGLSPRIYQSGTSVHGKGSICKMGSPQIRKMLYMCSMAAMKHNKTCMEMNERLEIKGKPHKVRRIAIANKLIKQAFSIVKSKTIYNENFEPKVCF